MNRLYSYLKYHADSSKAMDIDIQYETINYIQDKFNLSNEQVIWLSFLFASTYCVATAYYIFGKFPSYDALRGSELEEFWEKERAGLIFQTDARWTRSSNKWTTQIRSYQAFVEKYAKDKMQLTAILNAMSSANTPDKRYCELESRFGVYRFKRFSMFLFGELLGLAGLQLEPEFRLAEMRSVYNGVVFVEGREQTDYIGGDGGRRATEQEISRASKALNTIVKYVRTMNIYRRHRSLWSIETTLCAYKKWNLGKRYVGYYIERTIKEVLKMRRMHPEANWAPLLQFANKFYPEQTRRLTNGK